MTDQVAPTPARPAWTRALRFDSTVWWIWTVVAAFLVAGLFGVPGARVAALAVSVVLALWYLAKYRSVSHFPTQIRVAYAVLMVVTFMPYMTVFYWLQTAGTLVLILIGYCPMARLLLLMPWNRPVPLTVTRALRIVFHPPTDGSVLERIKL